MFMHIYMYIHTIDWENLAILTREKNYTAMTKLHGSPTPLRGDQRLQLAIPGSPISHSRLNTRSAPGTRPYSNRQLLIIKFCGSNKI